MFMKRVVPKMLKVIHRVHQRLLSSGMPRLVGVRGKTRVWRPHVRTYKVFW